MNFSFKQTLALWLIFSLFLWPGPAQADEPIQLILRNLPLQDDRLLVMTVQLENVADLYGAEIRLRYDPTRLHVQDDDPRLAGVQIAPGPLLAFDNRFVAINSADAQTGLIDFVFTLLKPAGPINQAGVLATVTFEVTGDAPLIVEVAEAKFVSSQLTAIPVATTALAPIEPPDTAETARPARSTISFGGVIAGILGVVAVGLLLLRLLPKEARSSGIRTTGRRIPGPAGSSTRTAALLTEQGYRAMQQGDSTQAYNRFSQAIELDPANAAAWLGKGLVAQQETEKRISLQRVLALDPGNARAQAELQLLNTSTEGL